MTGPLAGVRVIELGGMGPGPFAAMLLADHGAEVIRIDRPGTLRPETAPLLRSRTLVELDLKVEADAIAFLALTRGSDVLIEPFRPGVMERLGLGPEKLLKENSRLVFARMTGWGQDGPLARNAGHDINYIALSGALHAVGPAERPVPPLALLGDLGGGGMLLAFAICSALLQARQSGQGQVIDCAMSEGAGLLMTAFYEMHGRGDWTDKRAVNELDGGAPFYGVYETADRRFVAIGPLEPQFYDVLLDVLGLTGDPAFARREDRSLWPQLRARLDDVFRTRTRDAWCALFEGSDACFAPVLSMAEAPAHPQARARSSFTRVDGIVQPAPAPRFSRTPLDNPRPPATASVGEVLARMECSPC